MEHERLYQRTFTETEILQLARCVDLMHGFLVAADLPAETTDSLVDLNLRVLGGEVTLEHGAL